MKGKGRNFLVQLLIFTLMASLLLMGGCNQQTEVVPEDSIKNKEVLFAYVGANLKEPFTELAETYKKETGIEVEATFNNAGALLNQLETAQKGDLYMPGSINFIDNAREKGFIHEVITSIAYPTPIIVVPNENPAQINSIYDLANPDVELLVPDLEATAIGKTANKIFDQTGRAAEIKENIIANLESPPKVMAAIKMGQGNAGLVEYSNTINERETLTIIEIDPEINIVDEIPLASLSFSTKKEEAQGFLDFVEEKGSQVFEKHGFKITK